MIVEVTEDLQAIRNPILVDLNHVLANNSLPLVPNPEAAQFLSALRAIGTVLIVTSASDWKLVHQFLQDSQLWTKDLVLITSGNYQSTTGEYSGDWKKVKELQQQYEDLAQKHHLLTPEINDHLAKFPDLFWGGAIADKRVAFAFMKPHLLPIIDDAAIATKYNPGMLGIRVNAWCSPDEIAKGRKPRTDGKTLAEAAKIVRDHYQPKNR